MIHNLYNDSFEYCINKSFAGLQQISQLQLSSFEPPRNQDDSFLGKRSSPQLDPVIAEVLRSNNQKKVKESLSGKQRKSYFSDDSEQSEKSHVEEEKVQSGLVAEETKQQLFDIQIDGINANSGAGQQNGNVINDFSDEDNAIFVVSKGRRFGPSSSSERQHF